RVFECKKDNNIFIKNYEISNKFIKFILFKVIDLNELNRNFSQKKELERIFKNEITSLKIQGLKNEENILILRSILNFLLVMDNIECIVKLINEINDLPDSLSDLLTKVSIKNLSNGGNLYIKKSVKKGSVDLQIKFLLLVYLRDLWNNEFFYWLVELQSKVSNNCELEYLVSKVGK
ncbi:hypothetical protein TUBRATIS_30180, partial [Tubulinosema ratisbonensis]